jgi:hypothetical protein
MYVHGWDLYCNNTVFFSSVAYVWVLGTKTTVLDRLQKRLFFRKSNFVGSEKFQVSAQLFCRNKSVAA